MRQRGTPLGALTERNGGERLDRASAEYGRHTKASASPSGASPLLFANTASQRRLGGRLDPIRVASRLPREVCASPKRCRFAGISDGHGWVRTNDFSRVKRPSPELERWRSAGSLAIAPAISACVYARGLLGFIAVLVHRMSLWTSGGALVMAASFSSGLDRSEGVTARN
jgi:hypothetical protein